MKRGTHTNLKEDLIMKRKAQLSVAELLYNGFILLLDSRAEAEGIAYAFPELKLNNELEGDDVEYDYIVVSIKDGAINIFTLADEDVEKDGRYFRMGWEHKVYYDGSNIDRLPSTIQFPYCTIKDGKFCYHEDSETHYTVSTPPNNIICIDYDTSGIYAFKKYKLDFPIVVEINDDYAILTDGKTMYHRVNKCGTITDITHLTNAEHYMHLAENYEASEIKYAFTHMPNKVKRAFAEKPDVVREQLHTQLDEFLNSVINIGRYVRREQK